jgi:hypothetical protein
MAQTAKSLASAAPAHAPADTRPSTPTPAAVDDGVSTAESSPALALQAFLADALEEDAPVEGKWSAKKTAGFVAVSCGLLWAVVLGGLAVLT